MVPNWLWGVFSGIAAVLLVVHFLRPDTSSYEDMNALAPIEPAATTGTQDGHDWVDLGLSVKWATCNVGASSPSDYGSYFAWAETKPKSNYDWSNLKYRVSGSNSKDLKFSKYVGSSKYGTVDNRTTLEMMDDAARQNWSGSWRMPTYAEILELDSQCTWEWTTLGGHNGYRVTGKNGNSIFLPAAGWRHGTDTDVVGTGGNYWSSTLNTSYSNDARILYFYDSFHGTKSSNRRVGLSVRPVTE